MSEIKDENFTTIQGWMLNRLNLKGNELIIYAIIYSFSQDGESRFTGSRRYLADWCGCSVKTVGNALASLVTKGLITKHDKTVNGVHLCDYSITPVGKNFPGGREKITHHNIEDNIDIDTIEDKKERKRHSFDAIINAYTDNPSTRELLGEWLQNRKAKRAAMTDNAIKRNIAKLDQYAQESRMSVDDYLAEVVRRGWTAFYPIKSYQGGGQRAQQGKTQAEIWGFTPEQKAEDEKLTNGIFSL